MARDPFCRSDFETTHGKSRYGSLRPWAVPAQEIDAPEGTPPLSWMLLTTCAVTHLAEATEKIDWYTKRWCIEIYHKTLKSGCKIEERQLGTADTIEACLAVDLVVAWRIYHLTKLGREFPMCRAPSSSSKPSGRRWSPTTIRQPVPQTTHLPIWRSRANGRCPRWNTSDGRVIDSQERNLSGAVWDVSAV
jgi:hypothetical protein